MDVEVAAIIPAFNEADSIVETIEAIKQIESVTEIFVVNDGSVDNTSQLLENVSGIRVISNDKNRGKGYAIKAALPFVSKDFVLLVDADLKSSAIEMKKLVERQGKDKNTMLVAVYPSPLIKGGFGLVKKLTRKSLLMLTSQNSDSVLSGQRLAAADFLKQIDIPDNFGLEFKMTLEALRRDIKIIDIPLNIRHRETGRDLKGFLHRGKQFVNILNVVIRELM